ncbi:MAG: hypothetical protein KKB31_05365 [Nanoarchaeota archaeon]|nr:hypothetical protein [Nanoarchaeota archaeon]
MEKFIQYLEDAQKKIKAIDHMLYVTYPLVRDNRLLLKVLNESKIAIANCINAILQYEYLYKKIKLYKDTKSNLQTFINKCSPRCNITKEEIKLILDLFELIEKHKTSPFEFSKGDRIFILSETMKQESVSLEKTKQFLILSKDILKKTQNYLKSSF